jgi:glutamine synthetase adenylyltransferase
LKRLIAYLRENMILDFQGDLTLETLREFLKDDDSREARALLSKVVEDRNVSDMMIVLADCLAEVVKEAATDEVIREQLHMYSES